MNPNSSFNKQVPHPSITNGIACAASQIESNLGWPKGFEFEIGNNECPTSSASLPDTDDLDEVIEPALNSQESPRDQSDEEIYRGVTGDVIREGIDYLAFYKSFRFTGESPVKNCWGIFILKNRFDALVDEISLSTGSCKSDSAQILFRFIVVHELYHYKIDAYSLQLESTGGCHVYRPYRILSKRAVIDDWHEEAIANAYALAQAKLLTSDPSFRKIYDFLWNLVDSCPGAYARGVQTRQSHNKDLLAQQMAFPQIISTNASGHFKQLIESVMRTGTNFYYTDSTLSKTLRIRNCPIYWLDYQKKGRSVLMAHAISRREIVDGFILKYLAGDLDRFTDHGFCRIDNGEEIKLPNPHRKDVTRGEFKNIVWKAGMSICHYYKARIETRGWKKNVPRSPILQSRNSI